MDNLKTVGDQIESRLVEIRERIGAQPATYNVEPEDIEIGGDEINELARANPGEPIIINGRFNMAYIKDHSFHRFEDYEVEMKSHPNYCFANGNKVHFYYCPTLVSMSARGRKNRYRCATAMINKRLIDLRDYSDVDTRLAYCKHCIKILSKTGKAPRWQYWQHKDTFAEWGDATEYMKCVKELHSGKDIRMAIAHTRQVFEKTIEKK